MSEKTYGVFYVHPQKKSSGEYKDILMVEVFVKGNPNHSISKPVYDDDGDPVVVKDGKTYMDLYPKAWAKYTGETDIASAGIDLTNLRGLGPSAIKNLQAEGVETIEDLAELPDGVVLGVSGKLDMRNKARAYLSALEPEKLQEERNQAQAEKQELLDRIAKLEEQLSAPKKKAGRPRKTEAA